MQPSAPQANVLYLKYINIYLGRRLPNQVWNVLITQNDRSHRYKHITLYERFLSKRILFKLTMLCCGLLRTWIHVKHVKSATIISSQNRVHVLMV